MFSIDAAALPDFAQIYSFIGSLFDSSASDHLEELKKMDPINIETVSKILCEFWFLVQTALLASPVVEFTSPRRCV